MKILFSPSEGKTSLGIHPPINKNSFIFPELFDKRQFILDKYNKYIFSLSDTELNEYFGIKNGVDFRVNIFDEKTCKAILRYSGVAYDYLQYDTLEAQAQKYIDQNTIIFSNLFGPIKADDLLPIYRMKQGRNIPDVEIDKYYKTHFKNKLDEYLQDELVVDLRAGHYDKFYKPIRFITMKFLKNNKIVSHWAKAYRGMVLKEIATNNISTKEELLNLKIPNLSIKEIQQTRNKTTIIYDITTNS
ncbi:MAG: YaaA family protein [Epsilonproteobacteria bacterium]|nr:YaaA family protein [Campylobacterota bacterium]